jgi:hypothetical protein
VSLSVACARCGDAFPVSGANGPAATVAATRAPAGASNLVMPTRSPKSLRPAPLGRRLPIPPLLAALPLLGAACGVRAKDALVARRIEPRVREILESQAERARPALPREGTVPLLLVADGARAPSPVQGPPQEVVVSSGVPFAPGVLRDTALLWLRDARGAEVPLRAGALASWPLDRSIRSALIVFRAALGPGERAVLTLGYGSPPPGPIGSQRVAGLGPDARVQQGPQAQHGLQTQQGEPKPALVPSPDGPVAAMLPPSWYAASQVSGPQLPAVDDSRFPGFESGIESGLVGMAPAYDSYGVSCFGKHRTYYDGPHALYQRFLRNGDALRYRRARAEAVWYREHELRFSPDHTLAVHVCQKQGWSARAPLSWEVLRRLLGQGMLDDYLLTGDPAARQAVVAMGEALRQDLAALTAGKGGVLQATERNMAWTMMALSSYYAVDPRPELLASLRELMDRTVAWQRSGPSGAFEHDLHRADPLECERGPRGGSPFMTALLVDALMDYPRAHGRRARARRRGARGRVARRARDDLGQAGVPLPLGVRDRPVRRQRDRGSQPADRPGVRGRLFADPRAALARAGRRAGGHRGARDERPAAEAVESSDARLRPVPRLPGRAAVRSAREGGAVAVIGRRSAPRALRGDERYASDGA